MSDPIPEHRWSSFLRPWSVLGGFLLGLILLSLAGRHHAHTNYHEDFVRFHPMIAPDSMYQPTVNEMCSIVRSQVAKDQILVIIGGNSILLGVGQPVDRLWSLQLQKLLGSDYAVVNLAFRGATPVQGGAVVAEALRNEYPRQIYIANAAPMQGLFPGATGTYQYQEFDASRKGMLLPWPTRDRALDDLFHPPQETEMKITGRVSARLDSIFYFRDFWNWWSYTHFFTFATDLAPRYPEAFKPRRWFKDMENDFEDIPVSTRFRPDALSAEMQITNNATAEFYAKDASGNWVPTPLVANLFLESIRNGMPTPLRPRTLMLIGHANPFYTRRLSPDIARRDDLAFAQTLEGWQSAGYRALEYGRDFEPEDYGDRTHLTSRGGRKLADAVASKVRAMASELHYLSTSDHEHHP